MRSATLLLCIGTFSASALADRDDRNFEVTVLVSNQQGEAPLVDAKLQNAWGIAAGPATPWWVADNGTGFSTIYTGAGAKASLEVEVPGAPTGTVFNGGSSFELAPMLPALFLFASEDGTISGWNRNVDATHAKIVHTDATAIYKGLALLGDRLYATDFGNCGVTVLDARFQPTSVAGGFRDRTIPDGYCPFGIAAIGDQIFVTYAKKEGEDDVPGIGHGFVRAFDANGRLAAFVASRGALDSPWGLAMAPADFGRFGGCLLVGNFGNGRLHAFCRDHGHGGWHFAGALREDHRPLVIDGLWGIGFGNGGPSGATNVLYFAAGPDEEQNGAFGKIEVGEERCRP